MKLSTAIKRLIKAGYKVSGEQGSYIARKGDVTLSFFENGLGSDSCSKFTYTSVGSCAPTFGLSLKVAMGL